MRHNSVRDSEAQIMREVCRDVQAKPTLLPINENDYQRKVNTADNARFDISARGLWNSCEKTFFDIRITHPTSQSYSGKPWQRSTNNMKRRRIIQSKSDWHSEVFIQSPCLHNWRDGTECNRVNKRLAEKIAENAGSRMHLSQRTQGQSLGLLFWGAPLLLLQYEDFQANKVMFTSKTSRT